jgi:uncharacterized repeat protein (TIGR01451 family)
VKIKNVTMDLLSDCYSALVVYTPFDDVINGQINGADPAWLILENERGQEIRIHHTFNYQQTDSWNWTIDDFRPYLSKMPITLNYTVSYSMFYQNIGTGDATNVWVYDTLSPETFLVNSSPVWDYHVGDTVGWNIGYVPSGGSGYIFLNISFVYDNVKVKNWYPLGKLLINNASVDYSDTNGNFVEQAKDCAQVIVYVPSELKQPKMAHYSPVYQGSGSGVSSELMSQLGGVSAYLEDKYLMVFAEKTYGYGLETSSGVTTDEDIATFDNIVYIYLSSDRYETAPTQEEEITPVVDTVDITPIEIPSNIYFDDVELISIEDLQEMQVIELGIGVQEPPEMVIVYSMLTTFGPVEFEQTPTQMPEYEVLVREEGQDEVESTTITDKQEVAEEVRETEQPRDSIAVLEVKQKENYENYEGGDEDTSCDPSHDIQSPSLAQQTTSDTVYTEIEAAVSPLSEAVVSYLSIVALLFTMAVLLVGLFCWYYTRKRR